MTQPAALGPCVACGHLNQPAETSCRSCGSPLLAPERRVVVVLFADLGGYTQLCESLDPEEVHLLVRPLMNALRRACSELGGSVSGIEGDGLMAVFGARRSDPEDPRKSLVASARMQAIVQERRSAYGPRLPQLRVGVNAGEVLVAPSWEAAGVSVSGDVVNVASRLCGLAQPGGVLVSEEVMRLLPQPVAEGQRQRYELRHRSESVAARAFDGGDLPVMGPRRLPEDDTPFVGRSADLEALNSLASGGGVILEGEAGLGKTRLVSQWIAERADSRIVRLALPSFTLSAELEPLTQLARSLTGPALSTLRPAQVLRLEALLSPHAGMPVDEATVIDALTALVLATSREHPLILVFEDLHWASSLVRELLGALVRHADGLALTVVGTQRPEGSGVSELPRLQLVPLSARESEQLIVQLLPGADEALVRLLVERSGGVPFYVQQLCQLLLEDGVVEVGSQGTEVLAPERLRQVPTSLRLFVVSRLDLLSVGDRETLAVASVLGDEVDERLLDHLSSSAADGVEQLVQRGLLSWIARDDRVVLRFRHALIRDVAYQGLPRARRVRLHRAAAEWYSILPAAQMLESRALHLEAALEVGNGECDLVRETYEALVLWARSIQLERPITLRGLLDRMQALVHEHPECGIVPLELRLLQGHQDLRMALEEQTRVRAQEARQLASSASPELRAEAALLLARASSAAPEAGPLWTEAAEYYQEAGDRGGVARVEVHQAFYDQSGHGWSRLIPALEAAHTVGNQIGDRRLVAETSLQLAYHSTAISGLRTEYWAQQAEQGARADDEVAHATLRLATANARLSAFALNEADLAVADAAQLGERASLAWVELNALVLASHIALQRGDLDVAERGAARLAEIGPSRPNPLVDINAQLVTALVQSRRGDTALALQMLDGQTERVAQLGASYRRHVAMIRLQVLEESGRWEEAITVAADVAALDADLHQPFTGLHPRMVSLACHVGLRRRPSLRAGSQLRSDARALGAFPVDALAARWLDQDELLYGHLDFGLDLPHPPDLPAARALDHEQAVLRGDPPDRLLDAAAEWSTLGVTIWRVRALIWHSTLTGASHPEVEDMLHGLDAPQGLERQLRAQVGR